MGPPRASPPRPASRRLSLLPLSLLLIALVVALFAYRFWQAPTAQGDAPPTAVLNVALPTPSPTPSPSSTPTAPLATPTARRGATSTSQPAMSRATPTLPLLPGDTTVLTFAPLPEQVAWVSNSEPNAHFGDFYIPAGTFQGRTYYGAVQFDLLALPPGSTIVYADLQLTGLNDQNLGDAGMWTARLLAPASDAAWSELTYDTLQEASVAATLPTTLTADDLGRNQLNVFGFNAPALEALRRRAASGLVSFRVEGPTVPGDNLFLWDSGYGAGTEGGCRPRAAYRRSLGHPASNLRTPAALGERSHRDAQPHPHLRYHHQHAYPRKCADARPHRGGGDGPGCHPWHRHAPAAQLGHAHHRHSHTPA